MKNDKKEVCVKPTVCSNGHASTPNGRADDEGGGGSAPAPRVSYAAAARKPPSPQINNTPAPFPSSTGYYLHSTIHSRSMCHFIPEGIA